MNKLYKPSYFIDAVRVNKNFSCRPYNLTTKVKFAPGYDVRKEETDMAIENIHTASLSFYARQSFDPIADHEKIRKELAVLIEREIFKGVYEWVEDTLRDANENEDVPAITREYVNNKIYKLLKKLEEGK